MNTTNELLQQQMTQKYEHYHLFYIHLYIYMEIVFLSLKAYKFISTF